MALSHRVHYATKSVGCGVRGYPLLVGPLCDDLTSRDRIENHPLSFDLSSRYTSGSIERPSLEIILFRLNREKYQVNMMPTAELVVGDHNERQRKTIERTPIYSPDASVYLFLTALDILGLSSSPDSGQILS